VSPARVEMVYSRHLPPRVHNARPESIVPSQPVATSVSRVQSGGSQPRQEQIRVPHVQLVRLILQVVGRRPVRHVRPDSWHPQLV
jgi:hypothetical protein